MKIKEIIKKTENFIAQGETLRAIKTLLDLVEILEDETTKAQILILSSQYHEYRRAYRLNLEADSKIPNRINKALLSICQDISATNTEDILKDFEPTLSEKNLINHPYTSAKEHSVFTKKNIILVLVSALGLFLGVYYFLNNSEMPANNTSTKQEEKSIEIKNTTPSKNNIKNNIKNNKTEKETKILPERNSQKDKKVNNDDISPTKTTKTDIKLLKKAENEIDAEEYENGIALLDSALKFSPLNRDSAFFLRGFAKLNLNRYTEAIVDFNDVLKINKNFTSAYFYKSESLLKTGDRSMLKAALVNVKKDYQSARKMLLV
ncbi:MAG: tetratricopeptide repeat protein [Saprospiraceae bacterium]|nr:tetratricopeptide repeat protein [Saprospiraceae bacterium]